MFPCIWIILRRINLHFENNIKAHRPCVDRSGTKRSCRHSFQVDPTFMSLDRSWWSWWSGSSLWVRPHYNAVELQPPTTEDCEYSLWWTATKRLSARGASCAWLARCAFLQRGKFRPRLQQLVASNSAAAVERCSRAAFSLLPDVQAAVAELSSLTGVGPATASGEQSISYPY